VPNGENAYVYLLGFSAPANQDPAEVGARRLAWLEAFDANTDPIKTDPLQNRVSLIELASPAARQMKEVCQRDDRQACASEFESAAREWQANDVEALALRRYDVLRSRTAWRETAPLDLHAPLPPFADVMQAQRLAFLRLMQQAAAGDAAQIGRMLRADFAFWRAVQNASDNLITKMIAVAGLRNHFFYSNLVLRRLPADKVLQAVPPDWSREFSIEERSMLRVMAGELLFVENTLRHYKDGEEATMLLEEGFASDGLGGRLFSILARPMFQLQDQVNTYAERYDRLALQFAVPMSQYSRAKQTLEKELPPKAFPSRVYNVTGDALRTLDDGTSYLDYPFRVAGIEGMRRAALLVAKLRSRAIVADAVAAELASSELRDPYTDAPFQWNSSRRAVIFEGPEEHQWRRQEYFY
jgi:hypothetical protein